MDYLFIAPFPDNDVHTGNSLPVKLIFDKLILNGSTVKLLNLNKRRNITFANKIYRVLQIINLLIKVLAIRNKNYKCIYITIAESNYGIFRDFVLFIILKKKAKYINIHLLGGKNLDLIFQKKGIFFKVYKYFANKFNSIIVEGNSQKETFLKLGKLNNIYIVPNFSENYLFSTFNHINNKFENVQKIKIVFLSNMLEGKGHIELAKAISNLPPDYIDRFEVDFIGNLLSENNLFYKLIQNQENIRIHGPLYGLDKKQYLENAHIFCLPTYYPFEGQPFSIIEAYAAGCYVITCNHSGIPQIFNNHENGIYVIQKSYIDLMEKLIEIADSPLSLKNIALNNFALAKKEYTSDNYLIKIKNALENH